MTRKPPPEGARWTIPDWTPDSSAHEQEVVQYLDQLEMLRRDLAREREALEAKESEIARLKQRLEREKALPRESVENTERAESNVKLLREQQNIINDLEASIASITSEKTALEQKLKSKSSELTFWEKAAFTGVFVLIGVSLLHSIYALGAWGWSAITAPSRDDIDARTSQAALQCALQQRAIIEGHPTSPLQDADRPAPPPKALQPVPANFLSVGEAANPEAWRGVAVKNLSFTNDSSFFSKNYKIKLNGTVVNYSNKMISGLSGRWYAVALRGDRLDCEPIKTDTIYMPEDISPGNSMPISYGHEVNVLVSKDDDLIIRFFFDIVPGFGEAAADGS